MNFGDLNWVLAPLVSFLYTLGGWSFRTIARRIMTPISIVIFAILYNGLKRWWYALIYLVLFATTFAALTLPLTLVGDSLRSSFFNWVWIFTLGFFHGVSLFPLVILNRSNLKKWFIGTAILAVFFGTTLLISNLTGILVHKWVEILNGLAFGGVSAWLVKREEL